MGHEVHVVAYHIGSSMPLDNVRVHRIPNVPTYHKRSPGPSHQRPFLDLLVALKAMEVAGEVGFDVIDAYNHEGALVGMVVGRFMGIPVVFEAQGSLVQEMVKHGFAGYGLSPFHNVRIWTSIEKRINLLVDHIVPSSTGMARILEERFHVPSDRITVVSDGVNLDLYNPLNARPQKIMERYDLNKGPIVVYTGSLTPDKGVDYLIKAIPLVLRKRDATFLIVGDGNLPYYREMGKKLGVERSIVFTGRTPYFETPSFLNVADVAVDPKMEYEVGQSVYKVITYMAACKPIVAFDTPAHRFYLQHGFSAHLVPPGSVEALAEGIKNLLDNPRYASFLAQNAHHSAKAHSWDSKAEELVDVFHRVIGSRVG